MSEFGRRLGVALIGAPIALAILWVGDAALATLASALSALAAWEFFRLARESGSRPMAGTGIVAAALVPMAVHAHYLGVVQVPLVVVPLAVLVLIALAIWMRGADGHPLAAVSTTALGVLYTGGTLSYVYALRYYGYAVGNTAGALVVILPVLLTWSSDIGAYVAGRLIGGPKLIPSISPGKTIAGAIGGVVLTVLVCAGYVHWLLRPHAELGFAPWALVVFGVCISATAQVGDLAESLFKREAHVKDSGTLFPGHGGALDRLDSLFFVLPVSYALYGWLLIPAPH
ncbi:MAG: phosphatidate cytidylyltransferase [Gemmatimonadaceae bacterium]|nr:phosphatidate cytidylyltransferase [Gemmatimonadaceae bacterium]